MMEHRNNDNIAPFPSMQKKVKKLKCKNCKVVNFPLFQNKIEQELFNSLMKVKSFEHAMKLVRFYRKI